jgi:hypothetical protein
MKDLLTAHESLLPLGIEGARCRARASRRDFDDIAAVAAGRRTPWIVSPRPGTA